MQVKGVLIGILLCGFVGCSRADEIHDQFHTSDYTLPFYKRLRIEKAAPIIVLGRVISVTNVGGPKKSPGDSRIKTQLTRIRIDVEETIKGSVGLGPIEF